MATASSLENNNIKIPMPFGINATYGGKGATLPNDNTTPTTSNKASWNTGFPDSTFVPNNAPNGGDFNTLNNILSGLLMNLQLGQMINNYDSTFQVSKGGYPMGAILWYNTTSGNFSTRVLVQSLVDNNNTTPYINGVINSTYWKNVLSQRYIVSASSSTDMPSWWRVWSDGWIEQGGYGNGLTRYLNVPFTNNNYTITATPAKENLNSSMSERTCAIYNKQLSTFQLVWTNTREHWNWEIFSDNAFWRAEGF